MTIQENELQLSQELAALYDAREARAIADLVMSKLTGWEKIDRIIHKKQSLTQDQQARLMNWLKELLHHRPVQYVLGEAWFCGLKLLVNEEVLIPRPETEELANWVIRENEHRHKPLRVIDVCTGSGCVALAIQKNMPAAEVFACDISAGALELAQQNAGQHGTAIHFDRLDFLDEVARRHLPAVDLIVSNPPYIPLADASTIDKHVLDYEPHLALFVPDEDPLVFYKALAHFASTHLRRAGALYAELNDALADEVASCFGRHGLSHTEFRNDMQGRRRMIKATRLL